MQLLSYIRGPFVYCLVLLELCNEPDPNIYYRTIRERTCLRGKFLQNGSFALGKVLLYQRPKCVAACFDAAVRQDKGPGGRQE